MVREASNKEKTNTTILYHLKPSSIDFSNYDKTKMGPSEELDGIQQLNKMSFIKFICGTSFASDMFCGINMILKCCLLLHESGLFNELEKIL